MLILPKCHLMETWTLVSSFSGWGNKSDDSKQLSPYYINPARSWSPQNHSEFHFVPLTVHRVKLNDREVIESSTESAQGGVSRGRHSGGHVKILWLTPGMGVCHWGMWRREKRQHLSQLSKHWGETQINVTFNIVSFEILNNKAIPPLLNIIFHSVLSVTWLPRCVCGTEPKKRKMPKILLLKELLKVLCLKGPCEHLIHIMQGSWHFLLGLPSKGDGTATDEWALDLRTGDLSVLGSSRGVPIPHFSPTSYLILAFSLTRDT